ncbi:hypothetical protein Tco_0472210 [Tanacetum coccineum]
MEDDYGDGCYGLIVLTGINVRLDLFWGLIIAVNGWLWKLWNLNFRDSLLWSTDGYGSLMQGCYECFIIRFNNLVVLHGSLAMPANICVCYLDESYRVVSWFVSMEVSREGYLEVLGNNMCLRWFMLQFCFRDDEVMEVMTDGEAQVNDYQSKC